MTETVLSVWDAALAVVLDSEELDGIATALYTVGGPVGMDGLFDAYAGGCGQPGEARRPGRAGCQAPTTGRFAPSAFRCLETLADLGVVELGTEDDGSLTVALSPLGTWGVHRRLRAQGWHVPVLGAAGQLARSGLLAALRDLRRRRRRSRDHGLAGRQGAWRRRRRADRGRRDRLTWPARRGFRRARPDRRGRPR